MRRLVAVLAGLALAAAAVTALLVALKPPAPLASADAAPPGATQARFAACLQLQGESTVQNEAAVACMAKMLHDAVVTDTYSTVESLQAELSSSGAQYICHGAGHLAGETLAKAMSMSDALELLFHGQPRDVEGVCTTAIVHGLVQGNPEGVGPHGLAYLGEQCLSLYKVSPVYVNECAHYYGHMVWKEVGELNEQIGVECARLRPAEGSFGENACVGGAVMQKYDLQAKDYNTDDPEAFNRKAPTYEEALALCDVFKDGPVETLKGCYGGAGWLFSQRVNYLLANYGTETPQDQQRAVDEWVKALRKCPDLSCLQNVTTHFRIQDFRNGVAMRACRLAGDTGGVTTEELVGMCEAITAYRNEGKVADTWG